MKLFRDKNRGPKVKSEDVVIPESYLEYEREAEEKKRVEAREAERLAQEAEATVQSEAISEVEAEMEVFKARLDTILNNSVTIDSNVEPEVASVEISENAKNSETESHSKQKRKRSAAVRTTQEKDVNDVKTKKKTSKPKRKNEYPPYFIAFLVGIVVVVATVVVLLGPMMAIDEVDVGELKNVSEDKVIEMAGMPIGENLFLYHTSKAESAIRDYPYVEDVKITRHLPHRLEINITERQPAGVLLNNGNYLQFSKDGILLDNTKSLSSQSLPLITGFSMEDVPSPGEAFKDNQRFKDVLRIINACDDDLLRMLQEINIKDRNDILAYTSQGLEIRIGSVERIESRMAALNDIINQVILSDIIEEPIEAIDIRYEKSPVVVLEGYSNIDVSDYVQQNKEKDSEETADGNLQAGNHATTENAESSANTDTSENSENDTENTDTTSSATTDE